MTETYFGLSLEMPSQGSSDERMQYMVQRMNIIYIRIISKITVLIYSSGNIRFLGNFFA